MKAILERFIKKQNKSNQKEVPPFKEGKKLTKKQKLLIGASAGMLTILVGIAGVLWWFSGDEEEYTPPKTATIPLKVQQRPLAPISKPQSGFKPQTAPLGPASQTPLPQKGLSNHPTSSKSITTPFVIKPKQQRHTEHKTGNNELTIPPQFVGAYLQKALEDIKAEIKKEMEATAKKKQNPNLQSLNLNLDDIEPNLPKTITVSKVMQMPDGTIAVYYNGKWLSKGMEIGDGWIIENIDDKYIYIQKTFKKLIPEKGNKLKELKITKHAKIAYLISY